MGDKRCNESKVTGHLSSTNHSSAGQKTPSDNHVWTASSSTKRRSKFRHWVTIVVGLVATAAAILAAAALVGKGKGINGGVGEARHAKAGARNIEMTTST